ncbi:DNA-binding response regulator [Sphingobacterium faecium NBRC 15299]|uniref:response regulator transcription factor n=1 Tax=Sphingobacterium faecium TaxID=34087 RepID=UPI000D34F55A|nr:response regulator transcription factor [Sphingobacterium faecium]PTX12964.1 DNA-binding response OmpR family regulator [Sphingobacterium faecium]GEM65806.1 DNA-binding response regulator [Sphingobacterium faecium NBRC 15299]
MRVLVVEDNERVSSVLQKGLKSQDYQVSVAPDAESALKQVKLLDYDMLIIDIMLPRMSGIELSKRMKSIYPKIPIIMLTALGQIDEKIAGFDAGADDYMVKPFDLRELYVRIAAVLKRNKEFGGWENNETLDYDSLSVNLRSKSVTRNHMDIKLTPKEFDLLVFFMRHHETLLSRDEIARNVWGKNFDTGTNYIDVYINYLRKKVDKDFETKLIHTKSGHGFILSSKE